jgi:hypothetical protein
VRDGHFSIEMRYCKRDAMQTLRLMMDVHLEKENE